MKSGTFGVPGLVLPGCGKTWDKSGTSREIQDGWQPYRGQTNTHAHTDRQTDRQTRSSQYSAPLSGRSNYYLLVERGGRVSGDGRDGERVDETDRAHQLLHASQLPLVLGVGELDHQARRRALPARTRRSSNSTSHPRRQYRPATVR